MSKTITAEKWLTLGASGRIAGYGDGYPAHELFPNQIALSNDEYNLLRACNADLEKAKRIIRDLEVKIKTGKKVMKSNDDDSQKES